MQIIGCDYHPSYQRIAMLDAETGELVERRLRHEGDETRAFYAALRVGARVGIEASGAAQWFEQMLSGMGHELWVGDPARIRALAVRQQKTDARDARHLLELLLSGRFPRVWVPATAGLCSAGILPASSETKGIAGWKPALLQALRTFSAA